MSRNLQEIEILLLIKSLAKWETPLSTVVRSTKMGYQTIRLLKPVVHIYVAYPDFASTAQTNWTPLLFFCQLQCIMLQLPWFCSLFKEWCLNIFTYFQFSIFFILVKCNCAILQNLCWIWKTLLIQVVHPLKCSQARGNVARTTILEISVHD